MSVFIMFLTINFVLCITGEGVHCSHYLRCDSMVCLISRLYWHSVEQHNLVWDIYLLRVFLATLISFSSVRQHKLFNLTGLSWLELVWATCGPSARLLWAFFFLFVLHSNEDSLKFGLTQTLSSSLEKWRWTQWATQPRITQWVGLLM